MATLSSDFKNLVLSPADDFLTSFPAECSSNHSALARLLLPSYKLFILISGLFLLKETLPNAELEISTDSKGLLF